MNLEKIYTKQTSEAHLKELGQFFTPYPLAQFMCSWACKDASKMLDPAVGNSVFLTHTRACNPDCTLTGYEIDPEILDFFGNPADADLRLADYLLSDWETSYDAILCNPPYHRFQAVSNRSEILSAIASHTGSRYSSYTNLYILFLLKSLYQLAPDGRLAYIIPTEFLNSGYGTAIKEKLLTEKLIKAIINFKYDEELFFNATTTCCILLVDHTPKNTLLFYNLSSIEELQDITPCEKDRSAISIPYDKISPHDKWRSYLQHEDTAVYDHLTPLSTFCQISRGIATGANHFFCLTASEINAHGLSAAYLSRCICRSADIKGIFLTEQDYENLYRQDKKVSILDIHKGQMLDEPTRLYIEKGFNQQIHQKHLPSHRHPWYLMEQRRIAPIWVTNASRERLKFVRNLAGISSLTTFHSVYIRDEYLPYTDLIFCYFLTPTAQEILRRNRKELGNGLEKYQPSDLKDAMMLDITLISEQDRIQILSVYETLEKRPDQEPEDLIMQLDQIFSSYM